LAIRKDKAHLIDNFVDDLPDDEDTAEEYKEDLKETKSLVVDVTEENKH